MKKIFTSLLLLIIFGISACSDDLPTGYIGIWQSSGDEPTDKPATMEIVENNGTYLFQDLRSPDMLDGKNVPYVLSRKGSQLIFGYSRPEQPMVLSPDNNTLVIGSTSFKRIPKNEEQAFKEKITIELTAERKCEEMWQEFVKTIENLKASDMDTRIKTLQMLALRKDLDERSAKLPNTVCKY
jgi:hypothetical protein